MQLAETRNHARVADEKRIDAVAIALPLWKGSRLACADVDLGRAVALQSGARVKAMQLWHALARQRRRVAAACYRAAACIARWFGLLTTAAMRAYAPSLLKFPPASKLQADDGVPIGHQTSAVVKLLDPYASKNARLYTRSHNKLNPTISQIKATAEMLHPPRNESLKKLQDFKPVISRTASLDLQSPKPKRFKPVLHEASKP